jgi:hypothetical protein
VIDRRTFLAGAGAMLLAAPLAAEGQPPRPIYRLGIFVSGRPYPLGMVSRIDPAGPAPTSRSPTPPH